MLVCGMLSNNAIKRLIYLQRGYDGSDDYHRYTHYVSFDVFKLHMRDEDDLVTYLAEHSCVIFRPSMYQGEIMPGYNDDTDEFFRFMIEKLWASGDQMPILLLHLLMACYASPVAFKALMPRLYNRLCSYLDNDDAWACAVDILCLARSQPPMDWVGQVESIDLGDIPMSKSYWRESDLVDDPLTQEQRKHVLSSLIVDWIVARRVDGENPINGMYQFVNPDEIIPKYLSFWRLIGLDPEEEEDSLSRTIRLWNVLDGIPDEEKFRKRMLYVYGWIEIGVLFESGNCVRNSMLFGIEPNIRFLYRYGMVMRNVHFTKFPFITYQIFQSQISNLEGQQLLDYLKGVGLVSGLGIEGEPSLGIVTSLIEKLSRASLELVAPLLISFCVCLAPYPGIIQYYIGPQVFPLLLKSIMVNDTCWAYGVEFVRLCSLQKSTWNELVHMDLGNYPIYERPISSAQLKKVEPKKRAYALCGLMVDIAMYPGEAESIEDEPEMFFQHVTEDYDSLVEDYNGKDFMDLFCLERLHSDELIMKTLWEVIDAKTSNNVAKRMLYNYGLATFGKDAWLAKRRTELLLAKGSRFNSLPRETWHKVREFIK